MSDNDQNTKPTEISSSLLVQSEPLRIWNLMNDQNQSTPREHELKTDPDVYDAVDRDEKPFEIRKNDRDFKVGDTLWLRRTLHSGAEMRDGKPLVYTGESTRRKITYILNGPRYGLEAGWCIMGITRGQLEQELTAANQALAASIEERRVLSELFTTKLAESQQREARLRKLLEDVRPFVAPKNYVSIEIALSKPPPSVVPWEVVQLVVGKFREGNIGAALEMLSKYQPKELTESQVDEIEKKYQDIFKDAPQPKEKQV